MALETHKTQAEAQMIEGGVCAPKGFRAGGVRCGIKRKRRDIALLVCDGPEVSAALVGTQNVVRAPCVDRNAHLHKGRSAEIRAVIVNSGNANAGNGKQGEQDNEALAHFAGEALGLSPSQIWTASTGVIGTQMPMDLIAPGIVDAASALSTGAEHASYAAEAIMTTDTFSKEFAVEFVCAGKTVRIGGMAKGSGMIAPNMATMLAFLTTDVSIAPALLQSALHKAVDVSFNCLTVDGDTSTNDMCVLFASGAAQNPAIVQVNSSDYAIFTDALTQVCVYLAREVARDGEGATKLVTVLVRGTNTDGEARQIAKTVAESPLVKTALFGNDPNWGRILAAAGRAGVSFNPNETTAHLAGTCIFAHGTPAPFDAPALRLAMAAKEIEIALDLGQSGNGAATVYTCDFSYDYIRINAEYHT